MTTTSEAENADRPSVWSRTNIAAVVLLAGSVIWLAWWFIERSYYVYVSDARIASDMISLSSRTPGLISLIDVKEGQLVHKGQALVVIDDRDIHLRLRGLEADLATLQAEESRQQSQLNLTREQLTSGIHAEESRLSAANSALRESEVVLRQAEHDFQRATRLLNDKLISDETWELRKVNQETASQTHLRRLAEVAAAEAMLLKARAAMGEVEVLQKTIDITARQREKLLIEQQQLRKVLDDHSINSPVDGIIDEVFVHAGEYVYPGQRIMMVHNPDEKWIKANVKETEIRHIKPGSPVDITVDAWPDQHFAGTVARVGNAATSQFALMPSPNPSGNFTKVTQRLEVKVNVEDPEASLKPGMMVELAIHR